MLTLLVIIFNQSQVFQGMMGSYSGDKQDTYANNTIKSNSTTINDNNTQTYEDTQESSDGSDSIEETGSNTWPEWAKSVQAISHFLLTLYSTVTFLIYYVKQKTSGNSG